MSAKDIMDEWNRKEDGKQDNKKSTTKPQSKPQLVEKVQEIIHNSDSDESIPNEFALPSAEFAGSISKQNNNDGIPKKKGKLRID